MVTPFLKKLQDDGGTLFVFPSASKDLTRTFTSSDYEFKFSHFACVNIPDLYTDAFDTENPVKGLHLGTFGYSVADGDYGTAIAEHFQNYVMNFETAILNGEGDNDDFDDEIITSVSEKVFFNWLQKVGGISFNGSVEDYTDFDDRTIPYIGNIDVMNTVEVNGDSFDELYIHIPCTVGASTNVYFRNGSFTDNKNYLNTRYEILGSENIIGRELDSDGKTINGLSGKALFDDDSQNTYTGDIGHTIDFRDSMYAGGQGISTMNENSSSDFNFNAILIYYDFFDKSVNSRYGLNTNIVSKETYETGTVQAEKGKSTKSVSAKDMKSSSVVSEISSVAKSSSSLASNQTVKSATSPKASKSLKTAVSSIIKRQATNLYGILFLNKIVNESQRVFMERLPKKKETLYGNGNSFAIKVDLKIDTLPDAEYIHSESYIDPNTAVSMSLYERSLTQLQNCIDLFHDQTTEIALLRERVARLESVLCGMDDLLALRSRVDRLYDLYDTDPSNVSNDTILELIEVNSKKIDSIIHGNRDINLQYDMDVLQAGNGVTLMKNPNNVTIGFNQGYSINTLYTDAAMTEEIDEGNVITASSNCYMSLMQGDNLALLYIDPVSITDINLRIVETENSWVKGQSVRICLMQTSSTTEFNFNVYLNGSLIIEIPSAKTLGATSIQLICASTPVVPIAHDDILEGEDQHEVQVRSTQVTSLGGDKPSLMKGAGLSVTGSSSSGSGTGTSGSDGGGTTGSSTISGAKYIYIINK